jgi:hypothetical protein
MSNSCWKDQRLGGDGKGRMVFKRYKKRVDTDKRWVLLGRQRMEEASS